MLPGRMAAVPSCLGGRVRLCAAGGARHLQPVRPLSRKIPIRPPPRERVIIPGLEAITYGARMHLVPGLARPEYPRWERDYKDPRFYKAPDPQEMALYDQTPCYVFNQRSSLLEGVRQVAWLTKSKVSSSLPPHLLSLAEDPKNQIPNQDERVQNAIRHARFWDDTVPRPRKERYGTTLLLNLLHLCASLRSIHPSIGRRILAENYALAASWERGEDRFQVRGRSSFLHCSIDPLPVVSGKDEVLGTADHILDTFYPISPTIDLQKVNVYKKNINCTGFGEDYPYPHAHTLYFLELDDPQCKLRPEQFRAKMAMFSFGNALSRAHKLYGTDPQVLERPVTVQAVGTNGRIFQFLVLQLNTTDLSVDDGIKNQIWLEEDVELYDFAKVRPLIKKKQVKVPAGLSGYKPEAFSKFLALYLHGAV